MARKPKGVATGAGADVISREALIAAMRRLLCNDDFKLLRGRWLALRGGILDEGKKKPTEGQWSVLKGFDAAVLEADFWATKEAEQADMQQRAQELMRELAGG